MPRSVCPGIAVNTEPPMHGPNRAEWLGKAVIIAGVLVSISGLLVSVGNYLSTQRTNELKIRADEYGAFRSARDVEDLFWKNAYTDYERLFDEDAQNYEGLRQARLLAIADIVQGHTIPSFDEFGVVPMPVRCAVIARSEVKLVNLINSLDEQTRGDAKLVGKFVARGANMIPARDLRCIATVTRGARHAQAPDAPETENPEKQMVEIAPPSGGPTVPGTAVVSAAVSEKIPLGDEVPPSSPDIEPLSPRSDSGWDVDVFWCQGPEAIANYRQAFAISNRFAELAKSGRAIAGGVKLGRVRRRPASLDYQQIDRSAARWPIVIADSGPGEREAANALRDSANTMLGTALLRTGISVGKPTPWYLSLFLCGTTGAGTSGTNPGRATARR